MSNINRSALRARNAIVRVVARIAPRANCVSIWKDDRLDFVKVRTADITKAEALAAAEVAAGFHAEVNASDGWVHGVTVWA
jgi:hypothetical protein